MKPDVTRDPGQALFHQADQQVLAGKVVHHDNRAARNADAAHFRSEPRRTGDDRSDVDANTASNELSANSRFSASITYRPSTCERSRLAALRRAFASISSRRLSRLLRKSGRNAEGTVRCRRRPRELADPAGHWQFARHPSSRDQRPVRKRCRKSRRTGGRSGSCRAGPSSRSSSSEKGPAGSAAPRRSRCPDPLVNLAVAFQARWVIRETQMSNESCANGYLPGNRRKHPRRYWSRQAAVLSESRAAAARSTEGRWFCRIVRSG